jgi:hypothetical protein
VSKYLVGAGGRRLNRVSDRGSLIHARHEVQWTSILSANRFWTRPKHAGRAAEKLWNQCGGPSSKGLAERDHVERHEHGDVRIESRSFIVGQLVRSERVELMLRERACVVGGRSGT